MCTFQTASRALSGNSNLPRNATAAPITYQFNGQQYVAVATGGANPPAELIVLRLN